MWTFTWNSKKLLRVPRPDGTVTTFALGGQEEFDSACELLAFLSAVQGQKTGTTYDTQETRKEIENEAKKEGCIADASSVPIVPSSGTSGSPIESKSSPEGDSSSAQGAPEVQTDATIDKQGGGGKNSQSTEGPAPPSGGESHPTHGGEQLQSKERTEAGEPVDLFNGAFYLQETDLEIPNTMLPLSFIRTYRSGAAAYGPFGWNWDHNYNLYLRELNTGDIALWRNLHEEVFKFDGANFEPQRGIFEELERVSGITQVYEIKGVSGVVMRFERPVGWIDGERIPIVWIRDQHGNQLSFTYDAEDKLSEVRDDDDRLFKFEYDKCGLLVAVSDQAGRRYEYEHNEETMHLTCVRSPPINGHPEGITKTYHYEQPYTLPELRHNIVRIEDSAGNVYLENKYEQDPSSWSYARVVEQLYGGYLFQFRYTQLQWVPANPVYINTPELRVEVMNPDFGLETYTFNYRGDLLDRRYRLNKDKSFRVPVWQYEFDEQGNLSKTTRPDGSQEINTFDFNNLDPRMRGNLLKKELTSAAGFPSPSRIVWQGKYEPNYQLLVEERDELNAVTEYKYDFDLNPSATNNSGKLLEIHHPDATLPNGVTQSSISKFEYNNKGQLIAEIQPDGVRHEMVYGSVGEEKSRLIKQVSDSANLSIENSNKYDSFGFDAENIDGNGNSAKQVINALGLLEKAILPPINGLSTEFRLHYDSDKKVIGSERPKGNYTDAILASDHILDKFERDVFGYPTRYYLSSNTSEKRELRIRNDFRGFPVETINPDGSKIVRNYDERGLLLEEEVIGIDNTKLISKRVYDRSGRLIQETNSFGQITKYEYDGFSRISTEVLPNNSEIKRKWLRGDLLESEEVIGDDGTGNIRQLSLTTYTYDEKGRHITETIKIFESDPTTAVDVTTTYFYDQLDRIEKIIDNRGGIRTFEYDSVGRLIKETDPMGNEERFGYDNNGNIVRQENHHKEPDGTVSIITKTFTYDARNRRTEVIEPDGAKITEEYDDRDLPIRQTDYLGIIRETKFNSFNNKFEETRDVGGLNIVQKWTLDNMSRITSYIDPTGQVSEYHLDSVGRNYKTEYPNGFSSMKSFNSNGQIVEEVLGSGVKFRFDYDSANRLVKIENTNVPASINQIEEQDFIYDGLDRLISAKVGTNEVIRKYDSQNRLLSETTLGDTLTCKYNDITGEVEKTWPDGRSEKYAHDLNSVLVQVEEITNGTLGNGVTPIISFKPSGNIFLGEASYQGGLNITNKYDERKRLVEIGASSPAGINEQIKYRYDAANRKQIEAILGQNPKTSFYEFDNKYRLNAAKDGFTAPIPNAITQAEHNAAINAVRTDSANAVHEENFEYNNADARTKYSETNNPDKNYTYLPGYRIQSDGVNTYNHHTDGTLQSDNQFTYSVDALGRVIEINSGVNSICKIDYDALGRPSTIEETGKPIKDLNYFGGFVRQEKENGVSSRQITLHPVTGTPIAYHSTNSTHYTLFDGRFNLIGLTDIAGNLVETYRYKSFGFPKIFDATGAEISSSSFGIDLVFGGQRFLSSMGFYLSKRRLMNPTNGLYLSSDPKNYLDSSNLYVYAIGNPVDLIDPNGTAVETVWDIASLGIGIASFAYNISEGNYGSAAIDAVGIIVDGAATAVPFIPGGAGAAIKAFRAGNTALKTYNKGRKIERAIRSGQFVSHSLNAGQGAYNAVNEFNKGSYGMAGLNLASSFIGIRGAKNTLPVLRGTKTFGGNELVTVFRGDKFMNSRSENIIGDTSELSFIDDIIYRFSHPLDSGPDPFKRFYQSVTRNPEIASKFDKDVVSFQIRRADLSNSFSPFHYLPIKGANLFEAEYLAKAGAKIFNLKRLDASEINRLRHLNMLDTYIERGALYSSLAGATIELFSDENAHPNEVNMSNKQKP